MISKSEPTWKIPSQHKKLGQFWLHLQQLSLVYSSYPTARRSAGGEPTCGATGPGRPATATADAPLAGHSGTQIWLKENLKSDVCAWLGFPRTQTGSGTRARGTYGWNKSDGKLNISTYICRDNIIKLLKKVKLLILTFTVTFFEKE